MVRTYNARRELAGDGRNRHPVLERPTSDGAMECRCGRGVLTKEARSGLAGLPDTRPGCRTGGM